MLRTWIATYAHSRFGSRKRQTPRNRGPLAVEHLEERALFATGLGNTTPQQFAAGLYADILHRQSQSSEGQIWALALDNGATPGQVARGFIDSHEYRATLIDKAYGDYLHRNPEAGAVNLWISQMQSGLSYQSFLVDVLSSKEYLVDHGGAGGGWIRSLYTDLLGRQPDAAGFNFWNTALPHVAPAAIASSFVYSGEYAADQVTADYQEFLGRNPDPTGAAYWRYQVQQGLSSEQLAVLLASSSEAIGNQTSLSPSRYYGSSPSSSASSVQLLVPYFSAVSTPTVAIDALSSSYTGPVWIDVDLNHNGSFGDSGDSGQTSGQITSQSNELALNNLANGTYAIRARILGPNNQILVSPAVRVDVDTNQGFVGSSLLLKLSNDYQTALRTKGTLTPSFFSRGLHPESFDAQHRVGINVHATAPQYLSGLAADLENLGMTSLRINVAQQMVSGYVPMNVIAQLMTLPNLSSVTPIYAPVVFSDPVATEGAALIKAPEFRAQQGVSGAGQVVGILSDSMNVLNGLAKDGAKGALNPIQVAIMEEGPSGSSDEGRAMAQIVHAVAPGAFMLFHSASYFPQDMADGINLLNAAGAKEIVDDIGYLDEPMFNDGVISQAVDAVNGRGVFYASAAGNDGNGGFMTNWKSMTATVGGMSGTFLDLGGGNPLQTFTLDVLNPNNPATFINFISLVTQWDNAFLEGGSLLPNYQVQTEVDVYVTTADGSRILANFNDNTLNTDEALQTTDFVNDGSFGTNQFALAFQLVQGPAPTMLRWVNFADTGLDIHALHQGGPTIFGHPVAAGAVAVGAVPVSSPTTPEPFTAVGGSIPILFDEFGNRLATADIRVKPEVAGPDGVSTTFPAASGLNPFFGTSAAAPHVAAAAALLRQKYPTLTPAQVLAQLEATAVSVPPGAGRNDLTGFGLIQVLPLGSGGGGGTGGGGTGGGGSGGGGQSSGGIGAVTNPAIFGQTSDQATNLGILNAGSESFSSVIVKQSNGLDGNQWATWTTGQSGTYSATLSYSIPGGDLNFRLYVLNAQRILVPLAAGTNLNVSSQTLSAPVTPGETLYLWVFGYNHSQGNFTLTVSLS